MKQIVILIIAIILLLIGCAQQNAIEEAAPAKDTQRESAEVPGKRGGNVNISLVSTITDILPAGDTDYRTIRIEQVGAEDTVFVNSNTLITAQAGEELTIEDLQPGDMIMIDGQAGIYAEHITRLNTVDGEPSGRGGSMLIEVDTSVVEVLPDDGSTFRAIHIVPDGAEDTVFIDENTVIQFASGDLATLTDLTPGIAIHIEGRAGIYADIITIQ